MERQRNDRLGWSWYALSNVFQHRRQILRRCTESDTHANTFSDRNRDSYAYGNSDGNGYGKTFADDEATSYAGAAAISRANWNCCSGVDPFAPAYSVYRPTPPCRSRPRGSILRAPKGRKQSAVIDRRYSCNPLTLQQFNPSGYA
jgi:hypothetical protein